MVIPSGPLRESFKTVKNAQIVIINGKQDLDFEKQLIEINKKYLFFTQNTFLSTLIILKIKIYLR